ncbi:hypothetical protein KAR91_50950 [Candidatus Pacearchaeota archaeon]|nr:hypothetical protein [Candidatus Pacearchaeota archaeon]
MINPGRNVTPLCKIDILKKGKNGKKIEQDQSAARNQEVNFFLKGEQHEKQSNNF